MNLRFLKAFLDNFVILKTINLGKDQGLWHSFDNVGRVLVLDKLTSWVFGKLVGWHGFWSIASVCFGVSILNLMCMLSVAIGRSLLIFRNVNFEVAAWWPSILDFFGFWTLNLVSFGVMSDSKWLLGGHIGLFGFWIWPQLWTSLLRTLQVSVWRSLLILSQFRSIHRPLLPLWAERGILVDH